MDLRRLMVKKGGMEHDGTGIRPPGPGPAGSALPHSLPLPGRGARCGGRGGRGGVPRLPGPPEAAAARVLRDLADPDPHQCVQGRAAPPPQRVPGLRPAGTGGGAHGCPLPAGGGAGAAGRAALRDRPAVLYRPDAGGDSRRPGDPQGDGILPPAAGPGASQAGPEVGS